MSDSDEILAARDAARLLRGEPWSSAMMILDELAGAIDEKSGEPRGVEMELARAMDPETATRRMAIHLLRPDGAERDFFASAVEMWIRLIDTKCIQPMGRGRYRISPVGLRLLAAELLEEER